MIDGTGEQRGIQQDRLTLGAITAANIAAIVQLTGRENLTGLLIMSLSLLAFATPISIAGFLITIVSIDAGISTVKTHKQRLYMPMFAVSVVATILGFTFIFWHFHGIIAIIFLLSSVMGVIWYTEATNL